MTGTQQHHLYKTINYLVAGLLTLGTAVAEDANNIVTEISTTDIEIPVTEAETPTTDNTIAINQNVAEKIGDKYSTFLHENSESIITGLRTGNEITLTTTGPDGTATTVFTPPTGKMGYGNVSHAISLAKEQLSQYGITEPTASELQAALVGGEITTQSGGTVDIDGVLTLRSEGMGWGDIAHEYGVKLGHVGRSNKMEHTDTLMDTSYSTDPLNENIENRTEVTNKSYKAHSKHTVTAAGKNSTHTKQIKLATNHGRSHSYGHGIVTANGSLITETRSFGGNIKASSGKAHHAYSSGITTAAGTAASSSGISHGKGSGKRLAKGRNK